MATLKKKTRKAGGGGKLNRTQTVTVRLDARLRYLAELAARKQRRTVSSFIEWAIEESLAGVTLREADGTDNPARTIANEAVRLWDVEEADRFGRLATNFPELLSHHEQILWRLVRGNNHFWMFFQTMGKSDRSLIYNKLREAWSDLNAVARGEKDESVLPPSPKDDPRIERELDALRNS